MDAKTNGAALLAAAQGKRGELDALLETLDERELSAAILHLATGHTTSSRELIAVVAMHGLLANGGAREDASLLGVRYADALLAALNPEPTP